MINSAKEKMKKQAEELKSPIGNMLAMQISDSIKTKEIAEKVLADDKNLKDCKKKLDDYAKQHKQGNESVVPPDVAQNLIDEYFGFDKADEKKKTRETIDVLSLL